MLKQLFEEYQKNLNHFFEEVEAQKAEEIFHLFLNCKGTLVFSGVGKSGIIAEKLATTMISTGTKALYLPPINALHGDIGILQQDDLFVCISKSGQTDELLSVIPFVKKRGAKTIAWVSSRESRLLKECDLGIVLPFKKELCPFDLVPTTSTAIQLIFGDVLSVALMKAKKFSLNDYALNHPAGLIGKKIRVHVHEIMLKGDELPLCNPEHALSEVLVELTNKRCGCLLVVDESHYLKGIFTDGDLRRALHKDASSVLQKKMKELMTVNYSAISSNLLAHEALQVMEKDPQKRLMMLPVLEDRKIIGLIHMHDIIGLS